MRVIHSARKWFKLNLGRGKAMCENGADVRSCPYCENDTPVYRTEYGSDGTPVSFSVCVWCQGLIEYGELSDEPHEPYLSAADAQAA